jgi:hypothetical protein
LRGVALEAKKIIFLYMGKESKLARMFGIKAG